MNRQAISEIFLTRAFSRPHKPIEISSAAVPKVLMIGPSLQEEGGIGTVSRLIVDNLKDLNVRHISSWNNLPGSTKLPSKNLVVRDFILAWLKLVWELLFGRVDILHFHMAERGSTWRTVVFAVTAYAFNKPVVIHTHGAEFKIFYEELPLLGKKLIRWVLRRAKYLIVLSKGWQKYYVECCEVPQDKTIVLYNPVEYPASIPEKDAGEPIKLLFLGKINQRKGIYDLLYSFAAFKQNSSVITKLLIAGSGEVEPTKKLVEDLGLSQDIEFLGWITPKQRNELLAQTHSFILPSYNEGLPMALLEAMSWGLSIITTPVGGIGEVIKDRENGLLIEAGNLQELTDAISLLVSNSSLRIDLSQKAREKAAEFCIDNYIQSLSQIYRNTLKLCWN